MIRILFLPLSWALNAVPLSWNRALAILMADAFRIAFHFREKHIFENLKASFGPEKSEAELRQILVENYRHYAQVFLEIIRSISWSRARMALEVPVEGYDRLEKAAEQGGGFVVSSHMGNWEFSILAASARGLAMDIVVKRSGIQTVEAFLQWFRRRYGSGILHESHTAREILYSVSHHRMVAVILDQFMGPPIGLPVKFFGREAGTAVGLSLFVEKKDVPVFPAYNYRDANGKIHVVIEEPLDLKNLGSSKEERLYAMTQKFNDSLEKHVRKHPEQWLWLHRRWKEYRGEPRWILNKAVQSFTLVLLVLFTACSSKETASTPTGIEIPPDPSISVPAFKTSSEDPNEMGAVPEVSPSPTPLSQAKPKKKKKETPVVTPVPSVSSAPTSVNIIPVDRIPFEVGEKLTIELNWTALPAGRADIEVREGPNFGGRPTFHLWGNVLSSRLVDTIYHVDNTIESFVDKEGLIPYKFLLHMVESKQLKETRVSFDHVNQKAHYWAKRISERWGNQDIDRDDVLVAQSRDMFSALYYARALTYTMNKTRIVPVYENGQNWNVEVTPVGYEFVNSGVGAFQCWKLKVTAKLNNVLAPTGDMYLWVSDDSKKYPVKFDAKIKIGSLLGSLTSIKER